MVEYPSVKLPRCRFERGGVRYRIRKPVLGSVSGSMAVVRACYVLTNLSTSLIRSRFDFRCAMLSVRQHLVITVAGRKLQDAKIEPRAPPFSTRAELSPSIDLTSKTALTRHLSRH